MLKKIARWILRKEIKEFEMNDKYHEIQLTRLRNLYSSNLTNLKEQHMKELMILGDNK